MNIRFMRLKAIAKDVVRGYSRQCRQLRANKQQIYKCKLLVVGGGTAGLNIAWRLSRTLKKHIILLEPSDVHYYQPGFTLVAAGIRQMKKIHKPLGSLVPPDVTWLQDAAEVFEPANNIVYTKYRKKIEYDFMVVAVGIKNDYEKIVGLKQALDDPNSNVSTIYSENYCEKTWRNITQYRGGHALFTYPVFGGKCSGAVLKIMYLAHDYWRRHKIRNKTSITFNTANQTTFVVEKYAKALASLALDRDMIINYCTDLVEVRPAGAMFVSSCGELVCFPYNFLHVTPSMSPPACLACCECLVTETGFLDVNKHTLQHNTFKNIFGLGDCTSSPNSRTASAIGPQSYVVERNLSKAMSGGALNAKYNGYGACPLLTSYNTGMLAEYLYNNELWQTFPFDQSKERYLFYHMKVRMLPFMYWRYLIKGRYDGPARMQRILNPFNRR